MQSSDIDEQEELRQMIIEALARQQREQEERQLAEERPYLQIPAPELGAPPPDLAQEEPAPEERRVIIIDI